MENSSYDQSADTAAEEAAETPARLNEARGRFAAAVWWQVVAGIRRGRLK